MPKIIILDMQIHPSGLKQSLINGGQISPGQNDSLRLSIPSNSVGYCLSQLDDYRDLSRRAFKWEPPLRLEIRARASHQSPSGTLGFGFWNDPFTLSLGQGGAARRLPAPPQTCWFFYGSEENDLPLAPGVPGNGWKAASLRSPNYPPLLLAPLAGAALGLSMLPWLRAWIIQSAINIVQAEETLLDVSLLDWHVYTLEWTDERAAFQVDDVIILETSNQPTGPLGFVLWIDNQFAVASPSKGFHFGTTKTRGEEWLEVQIIDLSSS
jgi:hypothetical protein